MTRWPTSAADALTCPLCGLELARDRTGAHLVRCVYDAALEILFGPVGKRLRWPPVLSLILVPRSPT